MNFKTTDLLKNIRFTVRSKDSCAALAEGGLIGREGQAAFETPQAEALVRWSVFPSSRNIQIYLSLDVTKGRISNSSLQAVLSLDWKRENYLLMPGAVYDGNRYEVYPCKYPPFLPYNPQNVPVITDVPRLNIGEGVSKIELAAGDMTTPAAGFYAPSLGRGFFVISPHRCEAGYLGYTAEENESRSELTLTLSAPVLRERMYNMCDSGLVSDDTGFTLSAGQSIEMTFSVYEFDCASPLELFEFFAGIRKEYGDSAYTNQLPFSEAFRLIEDKYNTQCWMEKDGFYCITEESAQGYGCWQPGWVGGGMIQTAFLADGQPQTVQRSLDMLDFVLGKAQTPNGFFYGVYTPSLGFWGDDFREKSNTDVLLLRKQTDLLYFLIRQLEYIKSQELAPDRLPKWEEKVRLAVDALVRLWRKNQHWGQFILWPEEKILIDGSLSAVSGSGALSITARYFNTPDYLDIAKVSGEYYYNNFIANGLANGGPGEILQCPDSESAFGALESFVTLYEETGEAHWLDYALRTARLCAS